MKQTNYIRHNLILIWFLFGFILKAAPTELVQEHPISIKQLAEDHYLIDFGQVSFGNIEIKSKLDQKVTVHFGEDFTDGKINRTPKGTVRYKKKESTIKQNIQTKVTPSADRRNTDRAKNAVLTPKEWGVILPFRWVEIEGWKGSLDKSNIIRNTALLKDWDDTASNFQSSDEMLNKIWTLCKNGIKYTNYAGVYVDGDRERIPYEADAYINQLCHYYVEQNKEISRDTFDYLMKYPTWPTEWASHMVLIAHADWMHTNDLTWLEARYDSLKSKLFLNKLDKNLLVVSNKKDISRNDIVDWPKAERDKYHFTKINTVVNAFQIRSIKLMEEMARALSKSSEAEQWKKHYTKALKSFNDRLLCPKKGYYIDGEGSSHSAIHANLFPLAFGLVPTEKRSTVINYVKSKGMACSVYAAQYLLEALYMNGEDEAAFHLMTNPDTKRSWTHMVNSNATLTWEAWDLKFKPNQDWNHAWGAAPANIIPRYILGAEPITAGWQEIRIKPFMSTLSEAKGTIPTPHGPLKVHWVHEKDKGLFTIQIIPPAQLSIQFELPSIHPNSVVTVNGKPSNFTRDKDILSNKLNISEKTTIKIAS